MKEFMDTAAKGAERPTDAKSDESGLAAFAALLAMHRIAVDPVQLRHELGHFRAIEGNDLLRLAKLQGKQAGIRARAVRSGFEKLERMPLPALANGPNGWFLIGRVYGEEAVVQLTVPQADAPGPAVRKEMSVGCELVSDANSYRRDGQSQDMSDCHSAKAAERRSLNVWRSTRWRSELK